MVKAEVRGEDTDVTVHAKDDFPSQFPMIVVNTALLRSGPGLYTTAGVPDDVLSHIETSLRLLNMDDGVAFDRKRPSATPLILPTLLSLFYGPALRAACGRLCVPSGKGVVVVG